MKEQYVKAEMEIVAFEAEDIITTSSEQPENWSPDTNELPKF